MEKQADVLERNNNNNDNKTNCKTYVYLPCYYYFVTFIINIFFINLNTLNIDVFSPAGNQHHEAIYFIIIIIDLKTQNKKKLFYIM